VTSSSSPFLIVSFDVIYLTRIAAREVTALVETFLFVAPGLPASKAVFLAKIAVLQRIVGPFKVVV
jgi:hypothetical protein